MNVEWIPVSERMPNVYDEYLVTIKMKYDWEETYEYHTDVATNEGLVKGYGYIDGYWDTQNDWIEGQTDIHVTHWMPLPEPCRIRLTQTT